MSEPHHINFTYKVFVDGKEACDCTRDDFPLFEAAYHALFPQATIEAFTALQVAKRKKKAAEAAEEESRAD